MNSTSCPAGYATDEAFQLPSPETFCASPIALHWALTGFEVVVKLITSIHIYREWLKRVRKNKLKGRIPFFPLNSFLEVFLYLLTDILLGFGYTNVYNGGSFILMSLSYLPFCFTAFLVLQRTVKLGSKIIPLASAQKYQTKLSRFTNFGKGLVFFQAFSIAISSLVLIVITPILPEYFVVLGMIGFCFKGLFQFFVFFSLVIQYQRCISVVDEIQAANQRNDVSIKFARKLMRQKQVFVVPFMVINPLEFLLLCARVIPWNIYLVVHWHILGETVGSALMEFFIFTNKRQLQNKRQVNQGNIDNEGDGTSSFLTYKTKADGKGQSVESRVVSMNATSNVRQSTELGILSPSNVS